MTQAPVSAPRPALLTVDDDPDVSRAIARDLRRQYGDRCRIVRAESGPQALEALKELKLRGEQVAVLLADHRMPQMTGIEFLEQAMDIFPRARRVLLTAYADTDAAISAINTVDLDHYLLKPWSPPEEQLYPVVDGLLAAWKASTDPATDAVRVVGHRWSAPSHEVRDFLASNGVPYRWLAADEPEGERLLAAAGVGAEQLPVVLTGSGDPLVRPSPAELATAVGLVTSAASDFYDVVIVGGGPAGLGAAVYAASEGLRTVLIERHATGGQAGQSSRIENYLGFPDGVSGGQLTQRARQQAIKFGAELVTACEAVSLEVAGSARVVHCVDGSRIAGHTVVLAPGVSYRSLDCPELDTFRGNGVFYGAATTEAPNCAGTDVYVVGGANSAGQAAMYFSREAKSVTLLVRGDSLRRSMSSYLVEQLESVDTIAVRTRTVVAGGDGDGRLERLRFRDIDSGVEETVSTGHMFVFIGAQPYTEWLGDTVARDERGFVLAGPDLLVDGERPPGWNAPRDPWHLETSVPGVFVAGDVRSDSVKRVASAVGEGAMAISLVHRYLEKL